MTISQQVVHNSERVHVEPNKNSTQTIRSESFNDKYLAPIETIRAFSYDIKPIEAFAAKQSEFENQIVMICCSIDGKYSELNGGEWPYIPNVGERKEVRHIYTHSLILRLAYGISKRDPKFNFLRFLVNLRSRQVVRKEDNKANL